MINKKQKNINGFTLLEILIGVVISTIMMAAIFTSYNVVNNSYSKVTDRASISRSGRDIVTMMVRDIRMAGFKHFFGTNNLGIPSKDNLDYISGEDDIHMSHAPIIIRKNTLGYDHTGDGIAAVDTIDTSPLCCDSIHIVYGDFNQRDIAGQPYKRYRISYFADIRDDLAGKEDAYFSIFKTKESWIQDFDNPGNSEWTTDETICPECFVKEEVRSHIVDMEFIANGEDGKRFSPTPLPGTPSSESLFNIRTIDARLTFRSKKHFFRSDAPIERPRLVKGIGLRTGEFTDKYLRDSIFVTIHTRNIGENF